MQLTGLSFAFLQIDQSGESSGLMLKKRKVGAIYWIDAKLL
jgi:hypothetical protein